MTSILRKRPVAPAPTFYAVLGLPPGSTNEALHERYLELAFTLHPDRGGDEEKIKLLNLAWGTLKNKELRAQYDLKLKMAGNQCTACEGTGLRWTFAKKKDAECVACGGTGQKP